MRWQRAPRFHCPSLSPGPGCPRAAGQSMPRLGTKAGRGRSLTRVAPEPTPRASEGCALAAAGRMRMRLAASPGASGPSGLGPLAARREPAPPCRPSHAGSGRGDARPLLVPGLQPCGSWPSMQMCPDGLAPEWSLPLTLGRPPEDRGIQWKLPEGLGALNPPCMASACATLQGAQTGCVGTVWTQRIPASHALAPAEVTWPTASLRLQAAPAEPSLCPAAQTEEAV